MPCKFTSTFVPISSPFPSHPPTAHLAPSELIEFMQMRNWVPAPAVLVALLLAVAVVVVVVVVVETISRGFQ